MLSMITFGKTLAVLSMLAEQEMITIRTGPHSINPTYRHTDYESACGSAKFQVRFRNGAEEDGRVDHLLIDGRTVRDAAETLQIRAARRWIDAIAIMNCGDDPRRPVFRGVMRLSESASQVARLRDKLFFRLIREGGGWRLILE